MSDKGSSQCSDFDNSKQSEEDTDTCSSHSHSVRHSVRHSPSHVTSYNAAPFANSTGINSTITSIHYAKVFPSPVVDTTNSTIASCNSYRNNCSDSNSYGNSNNHGDSYSKNKVDGNSMEEVAGSDRKRNRRALNDDSAVEDILGQITAKLTTLTTSSDEQHAQSVNAFLEVLGCSTMEANFYLESAAWSIENAVVLWLENNPTSYFVPKRTGLFCNPIQSSFCNSYGYNSYSHSNDKCLWVGRDVLIEGLPQEWSARVNPRTGTIEFVHSVTGITQIEVPPGFADSNGADADGNNTLDNNGNNSFSNSYANNDGNSYGNSYGSSYGNNNDNSHDNCNNSMDGAESTTAEYGMDDSVEVQIDNDRTSICDRDNTQSPDNSTK